MSDDSPAPIGSHDSGPHEIGPHDSGPHEGPIKTPKQLILAVLYAFIVPVIVIVLLVEYVTTDHRPAAGSRALTPEAVAMRIQPVGQVQVKDASDVSTLKTGEQVFAGQCTTCHSAGVLGAPKLGDADAWSARIKTGYDALLHSALAGKGNMGAQGGGDYTDFEIGRAVVYMANKGGAKFEEPAPPAAGASAAEAAMTTAGTAVAAVPTPAAAGSAPPAGAAPEPAAAAATASAAAATATASAATTTGAAPTAATTATAPAVVVAAADTAKAGGAAPALYNQICQACHAAGLAGAPKLGDKAAWAPRIAQGIDGLTASAIKGKGAMPPKGGSNASEAEIKAVVTYMVSNAK